MNIGGFITNYYILYLDKLKTKTNPSCLLIDISYECHIDKCNDMKNKSEVGIYCHIVDIVENFRHDIVDVSLTT